MELQNYIVGSTLVLGTTRPRQSSSVSKDLIPKQSTAAPSLHATRLSYLTNACILAENDLSALTWTVICCGAGIRFSKRTLTVCVFPVLANMVISWPRMSISGKFSHSPSAYDCHVDHPQCRWWFRSQRQDQRFVVSATAVCFR